MLTEQIRDVTFDIEIEGYIFLAAYLIIKHCIDMTILEQRRHIGMDRPIV
jgi:hypothetical protein